MARSKLDILLDVKGDRPARQALKGVTGELDDLAQGGEKVAESGKGAGAAMDILKGAALGMLSIQSAKWAAETAAELYNLGTQARRSEENLDDLTQGQAPQYINAIKDATRDTVTEMEAARIATNLYGLGLAETSEKAGEMARVSAILGKTFRNLGAADAAEEFSLLLSNMSLLRLDTFGISSARVKMRMEELQAATAGMTREQAFYTATMEEATRKADTLQGVLDDQSESVEGGTVAWQDFKTALGESVAEGIEPAVRGLTGLLKQQNELRRSYEESQRAAAEQASTFEEYVELMHEYGFASNVVLAAARDNITLVGAESVAYHQLLSTYEQLTAARLADARALEESEMARAYEIEQTRELVERSQERQRIINSTGQAFQNLANDAEYRAEAERAAAEATKQDEEALRAVAQAAQDAYNAQKTLRQFVQGLADDQEQYGGALASSEAGFDNYIRFLEDSGKATELSADEIDQLALSYGALTPQQVEQQRLLRDLRTSMENYNGTFTPDEWRNAFDLVQTGQLNAAEAALQNEAAQNRVVTKLTVMGGQADTTAGESEDAMTRMGDAFQGVAADMIPARDNLDSIANRVAWLRRNGNVDINVNVNGGGIPAPGSGESPAGPRAMGGPVTAGQPYMVGERGPELFVPSQNGTIIPNGAAGGASGGAQQTIMPIYIGGQQVEELVIDGWVRGVRRRGGDVSAITGGAIRA